MQILLNALGLRWPSHQAKL